MNISTRFSFISKSLITRVLILAIFAYSQISFSQTIPATDGSTNCGNCAPPGWFDISGTPDVSDANTVAGPGAGFGASDPWNLAPLPLPPNSHNNWITIRDVGSLAPEEIVGTNITGLTVGRTYEVIIYSMTATTPNYSPQFINFFDFQIGSNPRVSVTPVSQSNWSTNRSRFLADNTTMSFSFFPGADMGNNTANLESVNLSITLDAINTVPVADDNSDTTTLNTPTTFNVTGTDIDFDGNVVVSTVDLDVSTSGIQNSVTTAQGTWSVDVIGNVTFTPANGFTGIATLDYTVQDDYVLDGIPQPATSAVQKKSTN